MGKAERKGNNYLWKNVSHQDICDYFSNFKLPADLKKVNLDLICEYICKLSNQGELTSWRVALLSKDDLSSNHTFSNGIKVGCWTRNRSQDTNDLNTYFIRKNHIVGNQKEEFIDLDEETIKQALQVTIERKREKGEDWTHDYPSPELVRKEFRSKTNPLLLIYPLNPEGANIKDNNGKTIQGIETFTAKDEPFIGFAISFPRTDTGEAVSYQVNTIADIATTEDYFDNDNDVDYDNE